MSHAIELDPTWTICKICYSKYTNSMKLPVCSHRMCLECHDDQFNRDHDNPHVQCLVCAKKFYRLDEKTNYIPMPDMQFVMALNAIEMLKDQLKILRDEQKISVERHAIQMGNLNKTLLQITNKTIDEIRMTTTMTSDTVVNHFYNK